MKLFIMAIVALPLELAVSQQVVCSLNVGDVWQYSGLEEELVTRQVLTDTLLPNGLTYKVVEDIPFGNIIYQRQLGDSIYQYNFLVQSR